MDLPINSEYKTATDISSEITKCHLRGFSDFIFSAHLQQLLQHKALGACDYCVSCVASSLLTLSMPSTLLSISNFILGASSACATIDACHHHCRARLPCADDTVFKRLTAMNCAQAHRQLVKNNSYAMPLALVVCMEPKTFCPSTPECSSLCSHGFKGR